MALPGRPEGLPGRPAGLPGRPTISGPTGSNDDAFNPTAPRPAAAPQSIGHGVYMSVGALSADQLLNGRGDEFDHLQPQIVKVRDWLQAHLTNTNRSEDVAAARLDPSKRAQMTQELDRILIQYMAKESVKGEDRATIVASVINEVLGLGPIEPLWSDNRITEVMVNGPGTVYVEVEGKVIRAPGAKFRDREHLLDVCQQILMPLNRRVDQKTPLADGRLSDGSRVNIVHSAVAPTGPLLTIRRFPETVWTMKDLIENGSVTEDMACELSWLVYHKACALVVGGTGAGKTSLLNAMSSCIPRNERVITVEDSLELRLHPEAHVAAMEARPASAAERGEVRIRDLVKNALRMRPDRIVVGEVRDSAALDMLQAMNTGHEGSLTTVHANGPDEAIQRLAVLVAQGGEIPESKVAWLIGDAVDILVLQRRFEDGSRRVQGIYEVPSMRMSEDGNLHPIPLWTWEQTGVDEFGKFTGTYQKQNDISEELVRARRLHHAPKFTLEDVYRMSELPAELKKEH